MSNAFDSAWDVLKAPDWVFKDSDEKVPDFSGARRARRFNERYNDETYHSSDLRAAEEARNRLLEQIKATEKGALESSGEVSETFPEESYETVDIEAAEELKRIRRRRKAEMDRKRKVLERMVRNESDPSLQKIIQRRLDRHNALADEVPVDSAGESRFASLTPIEKRVRAALKRAKKDPPPPPPPRFGENDPFPVDKVKDELGEPQRERLEWQKPGLLARIKNLAGFSPDTDYGRNLEQAKRSRFNSNAERNQRARQGDTGEYRSTLGIGERNFDTELHVNEIGAILAELNRRAAKKGKEFVPNKETQAYLDHIASVDPRELKEGESYFDAIARLSGRGYRDADTGAGSGYYRHAATFKDDPEHVYKVPQSPNKVESNRVLGADIMDNAIAVALQSMGYPFIPEEPVKGKGLADAILTRQPRAVGVSAFPSHLREEMGSLNQSDPHYPLTPDSPTVMGTRPQAMANEIKDKIREIERRQKKVGLSAEDNRRLIALHALLPRVDMDSEESMRVGEEKLQNQRLNEIIGRLNRKSSGTSNKDNLSPKKVFTTHRYVGGSERAQNIPQLMQLGDMHSANLGLRDGKLQIIDPMFSGFKGQNFLNLDPKRRKLLNWVGDTEDSQVGPSAMGPAGLSGLLGMLYGSHGEQMMEAARGLADKDRGRRLGYLDSYEARNDEDRKGTLNDRTLESMMDLMRSPAVRYRQALESILPYYEESVRDELPGFAEGLPDRDFYEPWFQNLLETLDEKQKEKEMLENKDLSDLPGDTPEARRKALREHEEEVMENERMIGAVRSRLKSIGSSVDKQVAYKRFLQLLADIKEDPEQSRLFEFANPTSAKFGEAIREAATRPKLSMESVLEQIDHEPHPRMAGERGEPATVVGADKLKRLYDEAIAGLKSYRGAQLEQRVAEEGLAPLSERAPDVYERQSEPRVAEKMLLIYNLLENQYGRNVADNWMSKYGSGSFIETLGAEGYKSHELPRDIDEDIGDRWDEGTGVLQDYGGVLETHPAWQAANEFLSDKEKREAELPDFGDIEEAQRQVGDQALQDMIANVENMPPEWQEKFKRMGGVSDRARDIARDQLRDASMNVESQALQDFYRTYGRQAAQEALDSWKAGGELQFDATGRMIDSPQAVEQAQMFEVPAWFNQDLRNINWPAGMVGVA